MGSFAPRQVADEPTVVICHTFCPFLVVMVSSHVVFGCLYESLANCTRIYLVLHNLHHSKPILRGMLRNRYTLMIISRA